jgi:TetR/AcrR family transcriptional repressor of nem operon
MKHAGLTHGAFYAHFDSKQALYAEAITVAAKESALAKFAAKDQLEGETELLRHLLRGYLDIGHVRQEQAPCPLAFLATDVANREADVRQAYTRVYKRLVALLNKQMPESTVPRRSRALALSALMIGGVAISRALNDERTVRSLLEACKTIGDNILTEG